MKTADVEPGQTREQLDREIIGGDETLLVGDLRYAIPLIHKFNGDLTLIECALRGADYAAGDMLKWSKGDVRIALDTVREVAELLALVREFSA